MRKLATCILTMLFGCWLALRITAQSIAPWTVIQVTSDGVNCSSAMLTNCATKTFTAPVMAGDPAFAFVYLSGPSPVLSGCSDNGGSVWKIGGTVAQGGGNSVIYGAYATSLASGVTEVTCPVTSGSGRAFQFGELRLQSGQTMSLDGQPIAMASLPCSGLSCTGVVDGNPGDLIVQAASIAIGGAITGLASPYRSYLAPGGIRGMALTVNAGSITAPVWTVMNTGGTINALAMAFSAASPSAPAGAPGPTGATGPVGATGTTGSTGPVGAIWGPGIAATETPTGIVIGIDGATVPMYMKVTAMLTFPEIPANACATPDQTIVFPGALLGDAVIPGWPVLISGLRGDMFVSAPNVVSVRLCMDSTGPLASIAANYSATILRGF